MVSQDDLDRVCVIIPALNEARSIGFVLKDLPQVGWVIVVDNGSTDHTARIAREAGAHVVTESHRGYGAACLRGLREFESIYDAGPERPVVVFLDADYSDHPDLLPRLVRPIFDEGHDFVLGSRLLGQREKGAMPPQSILGNRLACVLMRVLFGATYTDLGPFRAIDFAKLRQLGMSDRGFGWTIEMQIQAMRHGLRITERPVPYRRRIGSSKISGTLSGTVKAGYRILLTIGKHWIRTRLEPRKVAA